MVSNKGSMRRFRNRRNSRDLELYTPLDQTAGEIRLFTFQIPGLKSSTVRCRLRKVRLDDSVRFWAISYVWGSEPATVAITVNGRQVKIRPNLYAALVEFQRQGLNTKFWCDALCINQKDTEERNLQVLRMGEIFGCTERVLIWLGEAGQRSNLAIQSILRWAQICVDICDASGPQLQGLVKLLLDRPEWKALVHLLRRPWWKRIWTLQEVAVSRSATLMCGADYCDWTLYTYASAAWYQLQSPKLQQHITPEQNSYVDTSKLDAGVVAMIVRTYRLGTNAIDLLDLLRLTSRFDATDPRDKLYALRAINNSADAMIIPRYQDSICQVYIDFVRAFVREKRRVSFVAGAGIGNLGATPTLDLPSWVPNFNGYLPVMAWPHSCNAAGSGDARVTFSADSRLLLAEGVITHTIEQVDAWKEHNVPRLTSWVDLILSQGKSLYPTGMTQVQAFFRTMIGDVSNHALCPKDFSDHESAEEFYSLAAGFMFVLGSIVLEQSKFKKNTPRISDEDEQKLTGCSDYVQAYAQWEGSLASPVSTEGVLTEGVLETFLGARDSHYRLHWHHVQDEQAEFNHHVPFFNAMNNESKHRSLIITRDGHMGMAPPGTLEGDMICILLGCDVPVVIRKHGEHYLLVGTCYVYGMMHGEFMEKRDLPLQQIVLA